MIVVREPHFQRVLTHLRGEMRRAPAVHTERWQGKDVSKDPSARTYELRNVEIEVDLRGIEDLDHWRRDVGPNLPWADDHFAERVCGAPINPGVEWANWPWGRSASRFVEGGQFNHNYMERYWPKFAGNFGPHETAADLWAADQREEIPGASYANYGIRNDYGDLNDLVELLAGEPMTRQAVIPIFFPEDTGIGDGGRKPCTLLYQFLVRDGRVHVWYPLRSCDLVRHFPDDIYLTIRLLLWVLDRCRERNPDVWSGIAPGTYSMHCTSLHVFENDRRSL